MADDFVAVVFGADGFDDARDVVARHPARGVAKLRPCHLVGGYICRADPDENIAAPDDGCGKECVRVIWWLALLPVICTALIVGGGDKGLVTLVMIWY